VLLAHAHAGLMNSSDPEQARTQGGVGVDRVSKSDRVVLDLDGRGHSSSPVAPAVVDMGMRVWSLPESWVAYLRC
jgi:hypothetical protein